MYFLYANNKIVKNM